MSSPEVATRPLSRRFVLIAAAASVAGFSIGPSFAQADFSRFSFNPEGPSPSTGTGDAATSLDINATTGTDNGAVQSILVSPTAPGTLFIGTVNGGVWTTTNGGANWTPLTDDKSSLSIGSMAFKVGDPNTIYAGIGITSNGAFGPDTNPAGRGGARTGILVSNDGGKNWSQLAGSTSLVGKSVVGVAGNGDVVLAATAEYTKPSETTGYGLYRSVAGGSFQLVTAGLPAGPATSLVGAGTAANPYYVAIANQGVFLSRDNGGTWTAANLPFAANQAARVAVGPNGAVAVAVYANASSPGSNLIGLYLAPDGVNWRNLQLPPVITGGQASTDLAIAIDPNNPNIVYIGGDGNSRAKLPAYRVVADANGGSGYQSISQEGTANGTTSHADARGFAFDAMGRLLVASDGGVYARSNPQSDNGTWTGMNGGGLQLRESYSLAYDFTSRRLLVAAQDNGTTLQAIRGQGGFRSILGGDGVNVAVNDKGPDESIVYSTTQHLGFLTRSILDSAGGIVDTPIFGQNPTATEPLWNFKTSTDSSVTDFTEDGKLPFSSKLVLNRADPSKVAIGTNYVYITTDQKIVDANNDSRKPTLTYIEARDTLNASVRIGDVSALAYGTALDATGASALAVGSGTAQTDGTGRLYISGDVSTPGALLKQIAAYGSPTAKAAPATSIVFDADTWKRFYVADGTDVWKAATATDETGFTVNKAFTGTDLSSLKIERPNSVEFIASPDTGVRALLVGGIRSDPSAASPIAVAISRSGTLDAPLSFGSGLPNTMVNLLTYNPRADVLAVGLWGRGVWTLYDVTTYFPTADVLIYGRADNNSSPNEFYLSNGEKLSRNLEKWGLGTLTIGGRATYTGQTIVKNGTMAVDGSIASSSSLTVNAEGTLAGRGFLPSTTVAGTVAPGSLLKTPVTLTAHTSFTQTSTSTYNVLVSALGSDRIHVTGTAALAGQVTAQVQSGLFAPRQTYTIVSTTGGLSGTYTEASLPSLPFLQPSLSYDASNAYLTLTAGGFSAAAQTPAQAAVANALDASVWQATGDYATVISTLALFNTSQMTPVLTALSGTNYSAIANSVVQGAQLFMSNFQAQAGGGTGSGNRIALAEACDVACDSVAPGRWGAWGGALGGLGTVGAGEALGAVTYNLGGFAAGIDRRFGENFLAGVALGYATGTQWVSGFTGQGFTNTVQAGLYGSFLQGPLYVDALAGYALTNSQTTRSISIPGLATRTAVGQTGVNQWFGQLEGGWRFDIGTAAAAYVTPFARLQGYTGTQGAFSESGAESLSLNVAAQTTYSLRSVLGAQLGGAIDLGWRDKLALQLRLGWSHEYADTSRPVTATLAGAPATPFTTFGISPTRDGALLGLSASTAIAESTSAYLRYEGLVAGADSSHALTAGVRLTW